MVEAKRTLVKSAPELWAELSDPAALARHLEPFGGVRPTGARDEALVSWEGERGRGSITLEPSGFGTRVTLQAAVARAECPPPAPAPPDAAERLPWWARRRRRRARAAARVAPSPSPAPPAAPVMSDDEALRALTAVLDALGRAHHRPFSRA